ncbi:MAG: DUF3015 family protein [Bacteriovoracia bacterium]
MKRLLVIVIAALVSFGAFAQQARKKNTGLIGDKVTPKNQEAAWGMAGCGLGSVLFGETESRGGQILAVTTNDFYSNNTFAMSSGTSNCVPEQSESTAQLKKNMEMFVAANREALANDIAKSNGETISTLSGMMGCKDETYLGAKLQTRYETIFASNENASVSETMFNTVASDRYLVENCKL